MYYKNKYHYDASTIEEYLPVVIAKQYSYPILYIFDTYYQEITKDIIWEKGIPKSLEEDELDKDLAEQLEWV